MGSVFSRHQGFLYILPALLFVAFFVFWPLGQLVYISLKDTSLLGGGKFIGLENYVRAFEDKSFWRALWFTVKYTMFITPVLGARLRAGAAHRPQPAAAADYAHHHFPARGDRHRTIPSQHEKLGEYGLLESLKLPPPPLRFPRHPNGFTVQVFWDSDIGKWIEAAAYALSHRRDPDIEAKIEAIVDDFEKAQAPDGYTADGIAVHLYGGISTTLATAGTKVAVRETSNYPWSGDIKIEIAPQTPATFDVKLRIPGWCHGAKVAVNGAAVPVEGRTVNGYLIINRTWIKGDVVTLDLPMPPVRLYAHPGVIMDAGLVALKRGPLVYCVEEADNPGGRVRPSSCRASPSCRCRPVPICSTAS